MNTNTGTQKRELRRNPRPALQAALPACGTWLRLPWRNWGHAEAQAVVTAVSQAAGDLRRARRGMATWNLLRAG
ncbi:MAG: hypothetical protein KJ000_34895 [Pirellulaceae bacterium]|nr:hypothetical protein [Pirellulaceae bacterium]